MPKLEFSPKVLEDLLYIRNYITDNWGEEVAIRNIRKMIATIRHLEQFPLSGIDLGKVINVPTDYRYLFVEKNYVFYHLEFEKIRIVRVLNEQQDYMRQLFGISE